MATSGDMRWLAIAQVARLTGLSDETIRKYCIATPKIHFPSARFVNDRWEIPEDEARAAKVIDRSPVVARTGLTEWRLTQFERLGKLACSGDGKFSLDQEVYLHTVKALEDPAPTFEERAARNAVTESRDPAAPEETTVASALAPAAPALQQSGQPAQVARPEQPEIVFVRPGIALMEEFVAYMTEHNDPARLPDEFFAGEFALEFIPPVGVEYFVALGPGGESDDDGQPAHTWVRRYPRWSYDGKNLVREAEGEFCVEGFHQRGSVPDQYSGASAKHRLLRDRWNLRATEARARLKERARVARVTFLPDSMWRPDVRGWLRRYQEQRLHPSEFPDSVKAALVEVEFLPTHNMFFYASTGEVRIDHMGSEFTVIGTGTGFSDEFGMVDRCPLEPLPALLMWPGVHAEREVRPQDKVDNAEYVAWEGAWEDMQREGRRLKERRLDGE